MHVHHCRVDNKEWTTVAANAFLPLVELEELVLRSHARLVLPPLHRMPKLKTMLLANLNSMATLPPAFSKTFQHSST